MRDVRPQWLTWYVALPATAFIWRDILTLISDGLTSYTHHHCLRSADSPSLKTACLPESYSSVFSTHTISRPCDPELRPFNCASSRYVVQHYYQVWRHYDHPLTIYHVFCACVMRPGDNGMWPLRWIHQLHLPWSICTRNVTLLCHFAHSKRAQTHIQVDRDMLLSWSFNCASTSSVSVARSYCTLVMMHFSSYHIISFFLSGFGI